MRSHAWLLGGLPDVEASHLAVSKTENVSDRLVVEPVGLVALERFAFEIADGLLDFRDDGAIRRPPEPHGRDVGTDHGPLAGPVRAYRFAAMDVAAIHAVGPDHVIGERGQHAVHVPGVEAVVDAFENFDVFVHRVSLCMVRVAWCGALRHKYICTYVYPRPAGGKGRAARVEVEVAMDRDVLSTPGHLISLAARGYARLSESRLKPLGFGVGHLPVLVALRDGRAGTQRDLARFARIEQPPMAQMLARMERDGLIERASDPADRRKSRITLTAAAQARLPQAVAVLFRGNREALRGFTDEETGLLVALLTRLIANLDRIAGVDASRGVPVSEDGD